MTTVDVVLTPGVDTDQTASAQAQINTCPSGTLGSPNTINMPAGRYRIDGGLGLSSKSHIRWTCAAGVQTYPAAPSDAQAFVAYTDISKYGTTGSARVHFRLTACTNVIGSFMRIDGPNLSRWSTYPLYAGYKGAGYEAEHAFAIFNGSVDSGWEDCSWDNVYGDGLYAGGQNNGIANADCFVTRLTGLHAGRHNMCPVNVDGFVVTDFTGDYSGYSGIDIEPNAADERSWNITLERMHLGSRVYAYSLTGGSSTHPSKKNISLIDCSVIRMAHTTKMGIFCRNDSGGELYIENFTDLRNSNVWAMDLVGPWEQITVKDSRVRAANDPATSYGMRAQATDSLTVTGNNFNGSVEGADQLALLSVIPTNYVHWGNQWAMGTQTDGTEPLGGAGAFAAAKPSVHGTGTATNLAVGAFEAAAPSVSGVGSATFSDDTLPLFSPAPIGGWAFRFGSRRFPSRLGGAARLRGTGGPAYRSPFRLGRSRLRSIRFPNSLGSGAVGENITGSGGITATAAAFAALGAVGNAVGTGAFTAAAASLAGTAAETITGTGAFAPANAILAGTGAETNTAFGQFAASAASFAGTGAEGAVGAGAIELAPAAFAGVGSEGAEAVGGYVPPVPLFAGVGTETIPGTGAYTAPAAIFAGTSSEGIEGVGSFAAAAAILAGIVDVGAVTGSGAFTAAAPSFSGAGEGVAAGHGNFAAAAASFAGAASSEVLIVDVTYKTVRLPSTEKTVSYKRSMEKVGSP